MKQTQAAVMVIATLVGCSSLRAEDLSNTNFGPIPVPAENVQTLPKIALGKALFWDEQLSVTGTVACGTCHRPEAGGADPRSNASDPNSRHPGPDGVTGTADDVTGSKGVPAHFENGKRVWSASFGFAPQVTPRASRSVVNSAFNKLLLWDGRITGTFTDPVSGETLIDSGGGLEEQALFPLVNPVEMGSVDATTAIVGKRIENAMPLALAHAVPTKLRNWIAGRDYAALFEEVFGDPEITAARIAMALASYERSLVSDSSLFDGWIHGTRTPTLGEQKGGLLFSSSRCGGCHELSPELNGSTFFYTGVRPPEDDPGRFVVTNDPIDYGKMRAPSLRNVSLRSSFLHNGNISTLSDVVDFYLRGGDFSSTNRDARISPFVLSPADKDALLVFLASFTDPRLAALSGPFSRPRLFSESGRVPLMVGGGRSSGVFSPVLEAIEPPLLGRRFTVTVENAAPGTTATLVVSRGRDNGVSLQPRLGDFANIQFALDENGRASVDIDLGSDPLLVGSVLSGRAYLSDGSATRAFEIKVFDADRSHLFAGDFE